MILVLSGDIHANPGPVRNPCAVCQGAVASHHGNITCFTCKKQCHIGSKCGNIRPNVYSQMITSTNVSWSCPSCVNIIPPEPSGFESQQIPRGVSYGTLKEEMGTSKGFLKIAHINVNGIMTLIKLQEIKLLLFETEIGILGITETKLNGHIADEQLDIENYKLVRNDLPGETEGGGCIL